MYNLMTGVQLATVFRRGCPSTEPNDSDAPLRCSKPAGLRRLSSILAVVLLLQWLAAGATDGVTQVNDSRISPCPDTPNCVSSRDQRSSHYIEPLRYRGGMAEARAVLLEVLQGQQRAEVVADGDGYIRAVFRSLVFRFVDDVEFEFDDLEKRIHMKSASRVGHWDLGVNRRRCESIRADFIRAAGRSR